MVKEKHRTNWKGSELMSQCSFQLVVAVLLDLIPTKGRGDQSPLQRLASPLRDAEAAPAPPFLLTTY